ncbi:MAG: hypothetical protein EPN45_13505 [Rhizobiaceae bacterium]|nr:MAG: hypothetical protein EPN45_13505 [Rhizobiaceae bacterium]
MPNETVDQAGRSVMRIGWFHDVVTDEIGFTIRVPPGCTPRQQDAERQLWSLWQVLYTVVMRVCGNSNVGVAFDLTAAEEMLEQFKQRGITIESLETRGAGEEGLH